MLPYKRYLQRLLTFAVFLSMSACVVPASPLLQDWPCEKDSDCPFSVKCCPGIDGATAGKTCQTECKECNSGDRQPCYDEELKDTLDKGICKVGTQICLEDGTWADCQQAVYPAQEVCNGKDDDCDGKVDDGVTPCECHKNKATQECYTGDPSSAGKGICTKGTQTCQSDFTWSACKGDVQPQTESCNGKDDDCDGETDEGCQCPSGCNVDKDCVVAACGTKTSCVSGSCSEPETNQCVQQACKISLQCYTEQSCFEQNKIRCVNEVCIACKVSCTTDEVCRVCGLNAICQAGKCIGKPK